jgi:hypothetical protein
MIEHPHRRAWLIRSMLFMQLSMTGGERIAGLGGVPSVN